MFSYMLHNTSYLQWIPQVPSPSLPPSLFISPPLSPLLLSPPVDEVKALGAVAQAATAPGRAATGQPDPSVGVGVPPLHHLHT